MVLWQNITKFTNLKRQLKKATLPIRRLNTDPLFAADSNQTIHLLDRSLSAVSTRRVHFADSHFYVEDERLYEITQSRDGFACYNDSQELVWRFVSPEPVVDSVLTRNGLILMTPEALHYVEVRKGASQEHPSRFLEI